MKIGTASTPSAAPESYELTFRLIAGYDRFHVEQARLTLEQVRTSS